MDKKIDMLDVAHKKHVRNKGFLIFVFVLLIILFVGEASKRVALVKVGEEKRILFSKLPITAEDKKVINITSEGGGYYSEKLQIYISLNNNMHGIENIGYISLYDKNNKGVIKIERYKPDYTSLEDAETRTKNKSLKNAIKHDFETRDHIDGRVYDIKEPEHRIYSLYLDGYIYNFETSYPELYPTLGSVARSVRYKKPKPPGIDYPTDQPKWTLQRNHSDKQEKLFEFEKNGLNYIYRWKDTLLYTYMYGENGALTVFQHNITSGRTKKIFEKETDELAIGALNIIDNVLYISLGAYLRRGESYWIDLNSKDMIVHNLADYGGDIVKLKDRYYFVYGEGDACWGESSYSLIDLKTKKITPVADTRVGCIAGDEYVGINNHDQMILSTFKGAPYGEGYGYQEANIYTNLILIPLSKPSMRTYALTPQSMPKKILNVRYSDENDEVVMVGDSVYVYSFDKQHLEKIVDLPEEWVKHKIDVRINSWNGSNVCISKTDANGIEKLNYVVDIQTKQISSDASTCPTTSDSQIVEFPEIQSKKIQSIFKALNLQTNYAVVKEER